jgi:hypothetical protein
MTDSIYESPGPKECTHCIYRGSLTPVPLNGMRNTVHARALKTRGFTHLADPACLHPANFDGRSPFELLPQSFWGDPEKGLCAQEGWFAAKQWSEDKQHITTPRAAEVHEVLSKEPTDDDFSF